MAAAGFTVTGCGNDTSAYFTLTGIPERYGTGFAALWNFGDPDAGMEPEGWVLAGAVSLDTATDTAALPAIAGAQVRIPVWIWRWAADAGDTVERWSGTGTFTVAVEIFDTATVDLGEESLAGRVFANLEFTDGNASAAWGDGIDLDEWWD